ncbi:hypothetical protein, partial [Ralstonia sp.]|uniref:hypothetical protein n=1 Tax=Ralstonia sp. TaxID=54061 RepID=UPI00397C93B5
MLTLSGPLTQREAPRVLREGEAQLGQARARSLAATVALASGRVHAAARGYADAFELAEAAGERHAAASFLVNLGLAHLDVGHPGPATGALREGARRLVRLGRDADSARALYNLANAALLIGDDDLAGAAVDRASEAARRGGDAVAAAWASLVRAELAVRRGALQDARREADD